MIIVIEGTDGSGKQTQSSLLFDYYNSTKNKNAGFEVKKQSFPNYESPSAAPVKMYLAGQFGDNPNVLNPYQASALFAVDRLCTIKKDYEVFLENPKNILILDRYVQSNMLHQAGKIKDPKKVREFLNWLTEFEFEVLQLPTADKVIFLDMPVKYSKTLANSRGFLKNGEKKDIHEQDEHHMEDAYNMGCFVAKELGWDIIHCVTPDGRLKTIQEIHYEIINSCLSVDG